MDIILNKKELVAVLNKIQGITGRTTNIPGTRNVRIEARKVRVVAGQDFPDLDHEEILITATDLEIGYTGTIPAIVREPGIMAIDSRKLFEIAKAFPSEEISLVIKQPGWCVISSSSVEYQIVCGNVDDFPEPPTVEDVPMFRMGPYFLMDGIRKNLMVPYDPADPRPHTNSCHFEMDTVEPSKEKRMTIVSTNGVCMASFKILFPEETAAYCPQANEMIPKKRLKELVKFLDDEYTLETAGDVQVGFNHGFMVVEKKDETLCLRMAEGDFPKTSHLWELEAVTTFTVDTGKLKNTLKRISILNDKDYEGAEFNFSDCQLKIVARNPNLGEASETIPINLTGEPFCLTFNPSLWIELLAGIDAANISGKLTGDQSPCFLTGETNRSFEAAVMMMRS